MRRAILSLVPALLAAAGAVRAQLATTLVPGPEDLRGVRVGAELEKLVVELDHAEFARREAATRRLCDEAAVGRLELYAVLERKNLSAEQRHRLMTVVRERLMSRPRGAVGINMQFEPQGEGPPGPGAVIVAGVVPGMPADGKLRRGDRITHVDGEPLFNTNDLVTFVQNKLPGETVELVVERNLLVAVGQGEVPPPPPVVETLRLTLVLASIEDLERASPEQQVQSGPVLAKRQREADEAAEVYGPPVRVIALKRDQGPAPGGQP
jgi:hypothetical protein